MSDALTKKIYSKMNTWDALLLAIKAKHVAGWSVCVMVGVCGRPCATKAWLHKWQRLLSLCLGPAWVRPKEQKRWLPFAQVKKTLRENDDINNNGETETAEWNGLLEYFSHYPLELRGLQT